MRELEMFEPMISLLTSQGYRVVSQNKGRKRGVDLVAERNGRRLIMEMKGDSEAISVDLETGLFQLFRYIKDEPRDDYALGVSEKYLEYIKQVEIPLRRIGIHIFVIGSNSYQLW